MEHVLTAVRQRDRPDNRRWHHRTTQLGDHTMHHFCTSTRAAGLVLGATLAVTLALPALANSGHQSGWNTGWADAGFQGTAGECDGVHLQAGDVLWHFVQTKVPGSVTGGNLTAAFDQTGSATVASYKKVGAVLHWAIVTGQDTLLSFSSDVASDGQLNLSHICAGPGEGGQGGAPSDAPSQDPSQEPSQEPSGDPSDAPGAETSTGDPTDAPSQDPSADASTKPGADTSTKPGDASSTGDPTDAPGGDASTGDPGDAPTSAPGGDASTAPGQESGGQAPTATPQGNAAGATGTPRVTPPPTDTIGRGDTTGSSTGWMLAVAGVAALAAGLAVTAPSRRTVRRTTAR